MGNRYELLEVYRLILQKILEKTPFIMTEKTNDLLWEYAKDCVTSDFNVPWFTLRQTVDFWFENEEKTGRIARKFLEKKRD